MKIVLPSRNNKIDDHFDHCEYFTVFTVDTDTKEIINSETIQSPEGYGCKSNIAKVLADIGVTLMMAGNMGEGAVRVLKNSRIDVIRGCSGALKNTTENWLNGKIIDSDDVCREHEHNCHH